MYAQFILVKIINELMKVVNIVAIIVLAVALGLQVLNFVSQTKSQSNYKQFDAASAGSYDANSVTHYTENNRGCYTFVYAASGISCVFYIYLIIVNAVGKSPSTMLDFLLINSVIFLQFGVATVLAVVLKNNETTYETNMVTLGLYQSYDITGEAVDLLIAYKDARDLSKATMIVDYVLCFGTVLLVSVWQAKTKNDEQNEPETLKDKTQKEGTFQSAVPQ